MPTTATDLLHTLTWRYATKQFDAAKKIPAATWEALLKSLVLTPSSYGLQPWKFLIAETPALRTELRAVSWNQSQVVDSSHYVIFLARTSITEADIDRLIATTAKTRGSSVESLAGYRSAIIGDLIKGPRAAWVQEWAARQAYIALGQLMASCAALEIDACPMEGFDPAAYERILGLADSGYRPVVACAVGYRAATDKYATQTKVRFPQSDVVVTR